MANPQLLEILKRGQSMDIFTGLSNLTQSELAAWVTAAITLLGIIAALTGIFWQVRKQWLLHSATLITSMDERFTSSAWLYHRVNCRRRLSAFNEGEGKEVLDLSDDFPVLGFFENMAYLVRKGALHKEMVWNKFGWYVVGY